MFKPKGRLARLCLFVCMALSMSGALHAQSTVTPEDEYKKLIRVSEDIQPLGATPFGESVSLYNGSLSFDQTDVSLPGNGPLLQLSRSYHLREAKESESIDGAFSDWDIEIPRITTMTADQANVTGWLINEPNSTARCTLFGPPPTVAAQIGGADWEPTTWWTGYQLIVPGSGNQDLLSRTSENTLSPNMSGMTFPIVTKQNWMVKCGVLTDNETNGGEGFLAIAPDGTKYTFNHLVYRWAPNMNRPYGSDPMSLQSFGMQPMAAVDDFLRRRQASMLVTRVEDRFGNYLIYHYDGANLTAITASDGRALNLTYVPGTSRIDKATLQASDATLREWSYDYGTDVYHVLNKVTLPDNTSWSFDMADFLASDMNPAGGTCSTAAQLSTDTWIGSITHPSGLVGSFQVKGMVHGRSYVVRSCNGTGYDTPGSTAAIPRVYYQLTLVQKTFSGAGVPAETWHYAYSPANESWLQDCASGCVSTIWTDVVNPMGQATRYTFSNRFDATEGQLLATDFYSGAVGTTLLRSEDNDYATIPPATEAWPWPWPKRYGSVLQSRMNRAQVELSAPQTGRTISQDGDIYTWQAEAFNAYAQVTQTKRFNSIAGQSAIEEQTSYLNDSALWVLGLPLQVTNNTTGEVESSNTYNPSNDTLLTRARFGQPLMSYTFNSTGQLDSFTDGNTHTTTLGNYKRGIPQTIGYPDGTNETLTVDDFGQISAITDQAGHTTSYGYDGVGRITGITYPSGDEVAWLPKTFTYDFVTSAERGVPANHWRRTAATGSAKAVTYFNAMLQPVLSDSAIGSAVQASTLTTYDAKGQKIFSAYPSATALTFSLSPTIDGSTTTYDALGRVTQVAQDSELGPLTSTTAYLSGARQQVTDPKGKVTTTSYQVFDSPSYDAVTKVQASAGITQTIARDLYGNPLSITQSGLYGTETNSVTKTLTYDPYHRLCRTSEPESGSTVMAYDSANNLAWSAEGLAITGTDCGQDQVATAARTTRTYDAMNRVLTILPPVGTNTQSTQYHYTPLGQPDHVVSGTTTWDGAYNYRGMLTGESLQVTGQNAWGIGYAHDAYGSLSLIHYPDGENVSYAPDALGRPTQVSGYARGIGYFPNGQVSEFIYGNGTAYAAEQNGRQLLSNFSYGAGAAAQLSEDVSYDANGNITNVTDLAGGPRTKAFSYDDLNRLSTATATGLWGSEAYTYDALNNLRSRTSASQTSTYNYDPSNKLASITNGASTVDSFQYDNRGNVTSKNGAILAFDQKNQLTQIVGYDDYAYDAAGRRVMKTPTGGTPTYYFYNQAGQLLYQYEPVSNKATGFIYLGTKMIARNSLLLVIPDTPASITVPGTSGGSYTVSWDDSANAASYVLEQSLNGGAWTSVYTGSGLSQTMHQTANGSYTYQVKGCNVVGCSGYRASTPVVVTLPPTSAPTVSIPATNSTGTYTVSWSGVAGAATYILEEQINGGSWTTQQNTSATSETFSGKANGSYGYRVQASNAGGSGPLSTTQIVVVGLIPATPPAPHITVSGPDWKPVFALTWSAMPWATSYEAAETDASGVNTFYSGPATSASILILDEGAVSFQVRACSTYGCSAWSASTGHGGSAPTGIPTLSVPANSSTGNYTVSWTSVGTATRYTLQEQVNGGGWTSVQNSTTNSMAISGKTTGSYDYRVEACNTNGCGQWSAVGTIVVGLIPAAPPAPHITVSGPDWKPVFALTWSAMQWATRYEAAETDASGVNTFYNGPNTSASIVVLDEGAVSFKVRACSAAGCSAWSADTGHGGSAPTGIPTLSVPANSSTGSYTVSWTSVSTATSYTLQEQVNGGGWTSVQNSTATSRAISGKTTGSYGYHVEACNANGCGQWSTVKTIAVGVIPAVPGTPAVHASGPSNKPVVTVSWGAVAGATSYTVEETDPGSSVGDTFYSGPNTSASSLIFATGSVKFRVKACNATGCSGWSGYGYVTLQSDL
ncbi:RHS repeat protein [Rhodanobacter glycinis]|uniref:RHS repeat protein n=1 Tax=Rhodanobacter glycinis TaxID=582702 RepID=A0A502BTV1_9GAMM|nr:RHS repeat protein [Rhodanobacter glycinis]TPG03900.1 RHS repeat protein [Rhodanobacter glycinis]